VTFRRSSRSSPSCRRVTPASLSTRHNRYIYVHHKTPAREVDDPEKRNAMNNLVTLCAACHQKWEKLYPLIPEH